jgi:hypothetical protein
VACGEGVGRGVWEGFDVIFEEGRIYIGMKGVLLHAGVHVTSQSVSSTDHDINLRDRSRSIDRCQGI